MPPTKRAARYRARVLGYLVGLLALLPGWLARAQETPTYGRQIEQVHSVAGAAALLDKVLGENGYKLDSLQQDLREQCEDCRVAIPPPWQQADIDGDGRIDVVICDDLYSLAILNRGAARPLVLPISSSFWKKWCRVVRVARRGNTYVLVGQEIERLNYWEQARRPPQRRSYTLMYQLGALTNYAARPRRWLPRFVTFSYRVGSPVYFSNYSCRLDLKSGWIDGQGKSSDSARTGKVHYQLSAGQLDTLRQRLRYLPVGRLRRQYTKVVFDAGFTTLKFRYGWRPAKKVEAYGDALPHNLTLIVAMLEASYEQQIGRRRQKAR